MSTDAEKVLNTRIAELEADQVASTTKLTEFTTSHGVLEAEKVALTKTIADKDLSLAQQQNLASSGNTELETAKAALKAAEEKVAIGAESAAKLLEVTTTNEALTKSINDTMIARLKTAGVSDEVLTGKSKEQLEAMEESIAATKGSTTGVINGTGLGLGGGGGKQSPAQQTDLERDITIIANAKRAAGVPTT